MAATTLTDSLRETLAVFGTADPGTPLTTNEVADRLDIGRRSTYSRLDRLVERDLLETKKVGARGRVWWRPPEDVWAYTGTDADGYAGIERELLGSFVGAVDEYAIFMLDAGGRVRTWNDGAVRIKGFEGPEVIGEHVSRFYTEADREAGIPAANLATAEAEGSFEDECWRVRSDGSRFWAQVTITAIHDDGGELVGFTKVTRDLSDRREQQQTLRRERDLLERILETSPVAIAVFDDDGEALRANRRFADLLGLDPADVDEYVVGDAVVLDEDSEEIPEDERPAQRAQATGRPVTEERMQFEGADGLTRWLSVNAAPFDDDAVVVAMADVTKSEAQARRLARRREEVETELQQVFDRVGDAFWGLDDELRFTYVNRHAAELLERSASELVGANVLDELPWLKQTRAEEEFEAALRTRSPRNYEDYLEATGRWYDVRIYPSETGLSVYFQDVTERKAREEALAASERHIRALVDNFPNGVVALFDRELRHTLVGGSLFEVIDIPVEDIEGKTVREIFPDRVADQIEPNFRAVFDGESNVVEVEAGEKVRQFRTLPVRDEEGEIIAGLGMSQDVTERRRRERELERYETIVETVDDGIYALDEDGNFVLANDAFCELVGYDREELLGGPATVVHSEEIGSRAERLARDVASGKRERATLELELTSRSGEPIPVESRFGPYPIGDGYGRCGVIRDVADRRQYEDTLRALYDSARDLLDAETVEDVNETVLRTVTDVLDFSGVVAYLYDDEADVLFPAAKSIESGFMRRELPSVPPDDSSITGHTFVTGETARFRDVADSPHLWTDATEMRAGIFAPIGTHGVLVVGSRSVGEFDERNQQLVELLAANAEAAFDRVQRERELERYVGIVDAVGEPVYELDERGHFSFVNDAMVERSGYDESELLGEHVSIGMDDETVERVQAHLAEFLADGDGGRTTVEYEVITKGGRRIPAENRIYVRTDGAGRFTGSAGMLWDVTERHRRQQELERQRERLTALNELNDVVREITDAVIDQSTREEIERIVCERLAASDSYLFAWIGDVDGASRTVTLRAEAGVEGYLDDITISADPDDVRSTGPTGRALIEGEIQVSRDVENDRSHDPWREEIEEYGFRSSAAIPIRHEGTIFGALNVYADRPNAFDDDEQAVVGQLGEVVGHAIAAVERKQALMSDEVVEIEFQVRDVFEAVALEPPAEGTIAFDQAVPVGDGSFLVYGSASGDSIETIEAVVDSKALPHWESVSVLAADGGDVRFELRMNEPPVISTVASYGGYVHESTIENGDYFMRVHLAPGTDVRQIVDTVQEAFPTVVLVTRQQVTRSPPATVSPDGNPLVDLTDRQRTAAEAAFYAGYFRWPRDTSGGDLAASLGIDPSTFHYHLREAQRKILGSVLAAGEAQ